MAVKYKQDCHAISHKRQIFFKQLEVKFIIKGRLKVLVTHIIEKLYINAMREINLIQTTEIRHMLCCGV